MLAAIGTLFVIAAFFPSIGSADEPAEAEPLRLLDDQLERFPADLKDILGETDEIPKATLGNDYQGGIPLLDTVNRKIFQAYIVPSGGLKLLVRDLDTLEPLGWRRIPEIADLLGAHTPIEHRGLPAAVDMAGKRIFLWIESWNFDDQLLRRGVVTIRWDADPTQQWYRFNPLPTQDVGIYLTGNKVPAFYGMTYVPAEKKLYIRLEQTDGQVGPNALQLVQVNAGAADQLALSDDWARLVRSCRGYDGVANAQKQGSRWFPVAWSAAEQSLYIPCAGSGSASQVVRIPISDAGLPLTEDVYVGGGFAEQWMVDDTGGRLHAEVYTPLGQSILTFDMKQKAFVGLTAIGETETENAAPIGIDESTGRMYGLGQDPTYGLTLIDSRLTPPPPGDRYPQFAGYSNAGSLPYAPILFDPLKRHIFVPDAATVTSAGGKYNIFEDDPPLPPPPPDDPDAKTRDIPEDEGVTTQRTYTSSASGYGTRVLVPGGLRGIPQAPPFASDKEGAWALRSMCWVADRQIVLARVDETSIGSSLGRNGRAIAAESDTGTKADLTTPSRCDEKAITDPIRGIPNVGQAAVDNLYVKADENGQNWPFRRTECDGVDVPKDEAKTDSVPFASFQSAVDCSSSNEEVSSSSLAEPLTAGGEVTVASSGIATHIYRDPTRGIVSQVISFARGIDIGGQIKIDGVYALAETYATGRPKTSNGLGAHASYLRSIVGFSSPGFSCGHGGDEDACGSADQIAAAVNKVFAGNVQINFPPFENGAGGGPTLYDGTDKGYQAGIQRDSFDSLNSEFSNGDTLKDLPAIEIVRYNDARGWKKQRQVYQFAGVLANSQYGILPMEEGATPDPSITPTPTERPRNESTPAPTRASRDSNKKVAAAPVASEPPSSPAPRSDRYVTREQVIDQPATVGSTKVPQPVTPTVSSGGGGGFPVLSQVARVWKMLFSSPRTAGLLAAVWALFLLPFALAQRRYLLLQAKSNTGDLR